MSSFQERTKLMPRVSAEAGEYVIVETTSRGVVISEVAVCVTELRWQIKNGIRYSDVELMAFNASGDGVPMKTKVTF